MKKTVIGLVIFMLLGISSGVVWAYLVSDDQKVNTVSFNDTEIIIKEEFDPPGDEVKPGQVIKKIPKIQNLSQSSCYVRVRVSFSDEKAEQMCEKLQILNGWTLKADGFYYWNKPLKSQEETGALFEKLVVKKDAVEEEIKPFDVYVYAEAVQEDGAALDDAWMALAGGKK